MCWHEDGLRELYYDWVDAIANMRYRNDITEDTEKELLIELKKMKDSEGMDYRTMQQELYQLLMKNN